MMRRAARVKLGERYARWTALEDEGEGPFPWKDPETGKQIIRKIACRCECGSERSVSVRDLISGYSGGCKSCSRRTTPLARAGERYGRWTVLEDEEPNNRKSHAGTLLLCRCDCGTTQRFNAAAMLKGYTTGCAACGGSKDGAFQHVEAGTRFGELVVLEGTNNFLPPSERKRNKVRCLCDCGRETMARKYNLLNGTKVRCGKCGAREKGKKLQKVHAGERYGAWEVLSVKSVDTGARVKTKKTVAHVRCVCGFERELNCVMLSYHNSRGCMECGRKSAKRKLELMWANRRQSPDELVLRRLLSGAKGRCTNPNNNKYRFYGGRGLEFGFANVQEACAYVMETIGPRPAGKSLDRIDNAIGYVRGNLRWATQSVQCRNTRSALGDVKLPGWLPRYVYTRRLQEGWSEERARTQPYKPAVRNMGMKTKREARAELSSNGQLDMFRDVLPEMERRGDLGAEIRALFGE